ncbi:MAG: hypothetical protein JWM41_3402 [Gemmatimonadetes bacterium]|nr:hypothetical protein [Gemmatimonadota bacterium]
MDGTKLWIIPAEGKIQIRELSEVVVPELARDGYVAYSVRSSRGMLTMIYAQREEDARLMERLFAQQRRLAEAAQRERESAAANSYLARNSVGPFPNNDVNVHAEKREHPNETLGGEAVDLTAGE